LFNSPMKTEPNWKPFQLNQSVLLYTELKKKIVYTLKCIQMFKEYYKLTNVVLLYNTNIMTPPLCYNRCSISKSINMAFIGLIFIKSSKSSSYLLKLSLSQKKSMCKLLLQLQANCINYFHS
jgi:hypothetical protein